MKTLKRILGTACLCLAAFCVSDAAAAQRKPSVEETLKNQMDLLVKECKPSEEQQKTLKEKFKAKQDALEAWDKTNAEKMSAAQTAAAAARKANDADAKKKTSADVKALQSEREAAAADAEKAILAVLNDEQKAIWGGAQLAQTTLAKYKKNNLTDEQIAKVKSASVIAAKELSAISGDDRKDKAARTAVEKTLKWAIDNVIMTPEQRGETAKPAAAAPAVPAPAAPASAAPATPAPAAAPAAPAGKPPEPAK